MGCPETAIIIRSRNEERWLGETLARLSKQTYQDFEIIVVDSGSTDNTVAIAKRAGTQVVTIDPQAFTYPFAINHGIAHSQARSYYVILSAHSLPIGNRWLEQAIAAIKADPWAIGVYGPLRAMPDASITDRLIHDTAYLLSVLLFGKQRYRVVKKMKNGVMGFTNALIRKDLYEQHSIDNRYAGGGEDVVWTKHWFDQGYHAIKHLDFAVHHSHYLGPIGWFQQWLHWRKNRTPQPFTHLSYRKDGAHQALTPES